MNRNRVVVTSAVAVLLLLVAMAAAGASAVPGDFRSLRVGPREPEDLSRGGGFDGVADEVPTDSRLLVVFSAAVAVLAILIVIGFVATMLAMRFGRGPLRTRGGAALDATDDDAEHAEGLLVAVVDARAEVDRLRVAGRSTDAVIVAWLRVEDAADTLGWGRPEHQTPTEFAESLATRRPDLLAPLTGLRDRYQLVRFAGAVATDADAAAAADELAAIDAALRAPAEPVRPVVGTR